jgi:hypothetical protein
VAHKDTDGPELIKNSSPNRLISPHVCSPMEKATKPTNELKGNGSDLEHQQLSKSTS